MRPLDELMSQGYFYLSHEVLKNLDLKTLGLVAWLESLPKDFKPNMNYIERQLHICVNTYKKLSTKAKKMLGIHDKNYELCPRIIAQDSCLTLNARGLYFYLLTKPDKTFYYQTLAKELNISRNSLKKYFGELFENDYLSEIDCLGAFKLQNQIEISVQMNDSNALQNETSNFDQWSKNDDSRWSKIDTIKNTNIKKSKNICNTDSNLKSEFSNFQARKIFKMVFENFSELAEFKNAIDSAKCDLSAFTQQEQSLIRQWFMSKSQKIKAKLTKIQKQKDINQLLAWKEKGLDITPSLEAAINMGWRGLWLVSTKQESKERQERKIKDVLMQQRKVAFFDQFLKELETTPSVQG